MNLPLHRVSERGRLELKFHLYPSGRPLVEKLIGLNRGHQRFGLRQDFPWSILPSRTKSTSFVTYFL